MKRVIHLGTIAGVERWVSYQERREVFELWVRLPGCDAFGVEIEIGRLLEEFGIGPRHIERARRRYHVLKDAGAYS